MSEQAPNYGIEANETTTHWFERLVGMNAPADFIAAAKQILSSESQQGKDIFLSVSNYYC